MRTFFILVLFFAAFILVVSNLIAGVDLTPNIVGGAQVAAPSAVPATALPQTITIQGSSPQTTQAVALAPASEGCANPYTIRSGDSLSQIAVNCSSTLAAIRQANLQISNANLIYPGQQLNIPNADNAQTPVTGMPAVTPLASLPQACSCNTVPVPVTGPVPMLIPGTSSQVQAIHFPPNTPVDVAIGPKNTSYTVVTHGVTDANGNLTTSIIVPVVSNSQTLWVVVVETTTQPSVQAMSAVFNIDP